MLNVLVDCVYLIGVLTSVEVEVYEIFSFDFSVLILVLSFEHR